MHEYPELVIQCGSCQQFSMEGEGEGVEQKGAVGRNRQQVQRSVREEIKP